ncbi:MAG: rhodanese-like domain-containing protein [Bacteroidales bacterium]|nr:rhodanese-like domain-containing protein [Bacteroidales bacterium]
MGLLSRLFKITGSVELKEKIQNGALLLDVRTKEEYESGHASGSVNIPLDVLTSQVERVKKGVPVVAVCESGARSAYAARFLKSQGVEAYNGGSWHSF